MSLDEIRISALADDLINNIDESLRVILQENNDNVPIHSAQKELVKALSQFQPSPQLLDYRLRGFIERITRSFVKNCLYKNASSHNNENQIADAFYQFVRVRGTKTICNCMSSDIMLLTYITDRIKHAEDWELRYFLLLWLSVLVLVPFPLAKIRGTLPDDIYSISTTCLNTGSKELDAASVLMARFLSRVDCSSYLDHFISGRLNSITWEETSVFTRIGLLSTINGLLKLTTFQQMHKYLPRIFTLVNNEMRTSGDIPTSVLRLFIKILGKISLSFLRMADYSKVEDIITTLLHFTSHRDTIIRYTAAKQFSKICKHLDPASRSDIITALIQLLEVNINADSATIQNLQIDESSFDISTYHGVLMSLGEFCRMQLASERFYDIGSIVHKTLFLEKHSLTCSAGSNIRDASCFVCWSLFKKYHDSQIPDPVLTSLFKDLLLVCCFDSDLMVRRASSATIQELVGRHGDKLFELVGIEHDLIARYKLTLIEILDYTTLGRTDASYNLPRVIYGKLDQFMYDDFVDFLLERKITDYSYDIRKLSIRTVQSLLSLPNDYDIDKIIQDLMGKYRNSHQSGLLLMTGDLLQLKSHTVSKELLFAPVGDFSFDFHRDPFYNGEEYLLYISSLIENMGYQITERNYMVIFNIIRSDKREITNAFIELSKHLTDIPFKYCTKWLHYLKSGNNACAQALGYTQIIRDDTDDIINFLKDKTLDAELRARVIKSVGIYISSNKLEDSKELKATLIVQLNDYTVTNKGDVGSFVRIATIQVISQNLDFFSDIISKRAIELQLLRLSGEVMDNVKLEAIQLLTTLKGAPMMFERSTLLYHPQEYFDYLLNFYEKNYLSVNDRKASVALWSGYCFSGGSPQAVDLTINGALYSFLRLWERSSQRELILIDIISLLRKPTKDMITEISRDRLSKIQNSCLGFLRNLLVLNIEIEEKSLLKTMFIRAYNLTLGNMNYLRLSAAVDIFIDLYLRDQYNLTGCKQRLEWLSKHHPMAKVRERAYEGIEEIQFETMNE